MPNLSNALGISKNTAHVSREGDSSKAEGYEAAIGSKMFRRNGRSSKWKVVVMEDRRNGRSS